MPDVTLRAPGERQRHIMNIFVDHSNHQQATQALKRFYMPVEGGIPSRGNICALIGASRQAIFSSS